MKKILPALLVAGAVVLTGCATKTGPVPEGTEMDCIADGNGGVRDCVVDNDTESYRKRSSTLVPVPAPKATAPAAAPKTSAAVPPKTTPPAPPAATKAKPTKPSTKKT